MSRASTSSFLLLISILAGGCSVPSANAPTRPTQWFAQQEPVAQLPADDSASHTFVFAGQDRLRTVTFTDRSAELLRVDDQKVSIGTMDREIFFSPDGRHYAYPGKLGKGHVAVIDGQPRPGYEAFEMTISADSRHLAYIARVNCTDFAIIDGKLQPPQGFARSSIILTSNAGHWAYMAAELPKGGRGRRTPPTPRRATDTDTRQPERGSRGRGA